MSPLGVMFQHFHGSADAPTHGSISADDLRKMIAHVGRPRILPAREWIERSTDGSLQADQVCLTFDDNLKCQYDVAVPVLKELGLTACFFVCSSALSGAIERLELYRQFRTTKFNSVEGFYDAFYESLERGPYIAHVRRSMLRFNPRSELASFPFCSNADRRFRFVRDDVLGTDAYNAVMDSMLAAHGLDSHEARREFTKNLWMNADHISQLHRAGHVIGLHSHTHPTRLARLSPQQQRDEYTANQRAIRQVTGSNPIAMSHPCNSYSPYTLSILRQLGVRVGFRANREQTQYCPLEHPREHQANLLRAMRESDSRQAA